MARSDAALYWPLAMAPKLVTLDYQRTTFKAHHRPVVRALAEALFSPDGEASSVRLDAFVEEVDRFISPASKSLRFGLLALLAVLRWSPLLFGRFRTFDAMDVEERLAHLERLERSKITQLPLIVVAYKTVMSMLFYEDEAELRALGYPGAERKRWLRVLPVHGHPNAPTGRVYDVTNDVAAKHPFPPDSSRDDQPATPRHPSDVLPTPDATLPDASRTTRTARTPEAAS